jgi:hypothetical protein
LCLSRVYNAPANQQPAIQQTSNQQTSKPAEQLFVSLGIHGLRQTLCCEAMRENIILLVCWCIVNALAGLLVCWIAGLLVAGAL